jgi:predicted nucleotidyltransferase
LHHVKTLYAFGSVVAGPTEPTIAMLTFIVDFNTIDLDHYADNYFDLKFSLQEIVKLPIDLIEEKAIKNPYFKQVVTSQRELVLWTLKSKPGFTTY